MDDLKNTKLSPSSVAKRWNVGKTTIYRMMKDGEISYETNGTGKRELDLSEVVRVFGEPKVQQENSSSVQNVLAVQVLKEQIERQDKAHQDHIKSLQTQLNSYQEQVNKLLENQADTTKLLMHLQTTVVAKAEPTPDSEGKTPKQLDESVQVEPPPARRKKSLFGRILSVVVED